MAIKSVSWMDEKKLDWRKVTQDEVDEAYKLHKTVLEVQGGRQTHEFLAG